MPIQSWHHFAPAASAPPPERQRLPDVSLAAGLLIPAVIFAVAALTIQFSRYSNFIMTLWLADAILLVALLRHAPSLRNYGTLFAGGFAAFALANLALGNELSLSAVLAAANSLEVVIALALLSAFQVTAANLTNFNKLVVFIAAAGVIAPLGSDAITAIALGTARHYPWRSVWMHSYPAHALGMIMVAPLLISVTSTEWQTLQIRRRLAEAGAVVAMVIAVAICAGYFRSVMFIFAPAILFATVRFGLIGATVSNLVAALIASAFVVTGIGEPVLTRPEVSERISALQVLLAFMSLWCLPLAALLTERDRLLRNLSQANSQLKAESETKSHLVVGLRRRLSLAEEKERLRLSHELHDQAGQGLIAAILELNDIDSLIYGPARARLHTVRKKMETLGKTLHRIAWELRPPSIDELGLKKALASYVADWGEQCGTEADFHCDDTNFDDVPNEIGTAVYRVVQEGLTNIVKHARAPSSVSVVIRRVGGMLQVIIEDNGCGFDVGAAGAKAGTGGRGLGLDGMRERLTLVGGTLEIESAIGAGTTLFARIALDSQRSAA